MKIGIAIWEKNLKVSGDTELCVMSYSRSEQAGKASPLKEHVFLVVPGKQTSKDR